MKIWVINGPNLNILGAREPDVYGSLSLTDINRRLSDWGILHGVELEFFQANCEGQIINALQEVGTKGQGVVLNPGAFGHYSLAIADAISALSIPVIEVHLTNVFARDPDRQRQLTGSRCFGYIAGLGWRGYRLALETLVELTEEGE